MQIQYTVYIIADEVDAVNQVEVPFPEIFGGVALFIDGDTYMREEAWIPQDSPINQLDTGIKK